MCCCLFGGCSDDVVSLSGFRIDDTADDSLIDFVGDVDVDNIAVVDGGDMVHCLAI